MAGVAVVSASPAWANPTGPKSSLRRPVQDSHQQSQSPNSPTHHPRRLLEPKAASLLSLSSGPRARLNRGGVRISRIPRPSSLTGRFFLITRRHRGRRERRIKRPVFGSRDIWCASSQASSFHAKARRADRQPGLDQAARRHVILVAPSIDNSGTSRRER